MADRSMTAVAKALEAVGMDVCGSLSVPGEGLEAARSHAGAQSHRCGGGEAALKDRRGRPWAAAPPPCSPRMATNATACCCLSAASGGREKLRVAHLASIGVPVLCFNGTRDELCRRELMESAVKGLERWQMHWLEGADHSCVLKSSGRTDADVLREVAEASRAWLEAHGRK